MEGKVHRLIRLMNAPIPSLFGKETEVAVAAISPEGRHLSPQESANLLFEQARLDLPHLPCDGGPGIFLATGGRFYPDSGEHPEITTPEVCHPTDLVRHSRAGEAILAGLAKSLQAGGRVGSMRIFQHHANYGPDGSITWGTAHESYLGRRPGSILEDPRSQTARSRTLIPFLISRLIFTGSGGFNSLFPGIEFLLSPRVAHLTCPVSACSTSDRPIFHLRPESLTKGNLGYDRTHLVCGEQNLADRSLYLKFATTLLIITMQDAGIALPTLEIVNPVRCMYRFAKDWKLKHRALTTGGKRMCAIEIQGLFLAAAESAADHPEMPPWTAEALDQWGKALDELTRSAGREPVDENEESLDWRIKHALFGKALAKRDFTWREVQKWNAVLSAVVKSRSGGGKPFPYPTARTIEEPNDDREPLAVAARPFIAKLGLRESRFAEFLRLRDALQELDIRLMEIGDEGLFASLERAGCVRHQMVSKDSIRVARHHPPSGTRALIRGSMIARLHRAGGKDRFAASWEGIRDRVKNRLLDLGNPHETKIRWIDATDAPDPAMPFFGHSSPIPVPSFPFSEVLAFYDSGDYRAGWRLLDSYVHRSLVPGFSEENLSYDYLRFRTWFAARLGLRPETFTALDLLRRRTRGSVAPHADIVLALLNLGLAGHDSIDTSIESGFSECGGPASADAAFLSNAACRRLRTGDTDTAREWLDLALRESTFQASHQHTQARILAHRGECSRREGRLDEAADWLRRSEELYLRGGFHGDHADFFAPYMAKWCRCQGQDHESIEHLTQALEVQTRLRNPGQVRTRLLIAQFGGDSGEATRRAIVGTARKFTAFRDCPRLRSILEHENWIPWCEGRLSGPLADAV